MPNEKKSPSAAKPGALSKSAEALSMIKAEIAALPASEIKVINVDIPQAVSLILGVLPHLAALRAEIVKELPRFPIALFDGLEVYALAALHAHVLWLPPEVAEDKVATLLDEAKKLRVTLLGDARALANRGLVDAKTVRDIEADQGNLDTAKDLIALAALFSATWDEIAGKTAAMPEEVARAGELGPQLLAALGAREHKVELAPDAIAEQRRRAFTLMFRAYDETRRAVSFLRWHEGDADELAPSVFKGRKKRAASGGEKGGGEEKKGGGEEPKGG